VSNATTTNTTTGNIALRTAGNIAFNAALTVGGASATKALTLNAAGASSAITQTAAIKSTGLELLGANASYTLTNTGNDIKKIAGNTKLVSLTNNSAFAIDTVNTVGLTTSGNTTFNSTAAVTENQKLDTAGLELLGVGGNYTLNNTGNNIRKIAGNTGAVSLTNDSAFAIDTVNTVGLTTSGNTTFSSIAAVTQTQKVAATGLELLGTGGSYTLTNASNNVATLAASTGALSFANGVNLAVDTVNTVGITTNTGDVTLVSNNGVTVSANINSNGNDIAITANGNGGTSKGFEQSAGTINAGAGDIAIVGTTKTATGWPNRIGADVRGTITGNNISITGTSDTAAATDGMGVQFQGASSVNATGTLTVTGEVKGGGTGRAVVIGNGMSTPTLLSGATGIDITGTLSSASAGSADNTGVFIDASGVTATSSGGAINITGESTSAGAAFSKNAVFLKYAINLAALNGTTIEGTSVGTGASVNIDPEANISVTTGALAIQTGGNSSSTAFITSGANALITQNSNAGVTLTTEGQGNITAPKIINNGTGDVIVAAGSAIAAGTGTGGQVLTVVGNSITQNSTGKTYIYSGNAASTGVLSNLSSDFSTLYYQGSSYAVNAAFNTTFDGTPADDLSAPVGGSITTGAQVFFRSTTKPGFSLAVDDVSKTYGDADPTTFSITGGATTLTNAYAGVGGNNNFAVASADVLAALTGPRIAGEDVGSYAYSLDGSAMNATLSAQPDLNITKRDITLTSVTAADKVYDGNTLATINGGVFGNLVGVETLSLSGAGVYTNTNAGNGKALSVADATALTQVDGTGLWSNYNLTTTGAVSGTGNITAAPLSITVNNSSVFVTRDPSSAIDQGFTYSGFVNGETAATALTTPLIRYYQGPNTPGAGTVANSLRLLNPAVAANGNYTITEHYGDLTVLPATSLLINVSSQSATYGTKTATNASIPGAGTVSAQYCLTGTCIGSDLVNLSLTRDPNVANQWLASDGTGSTVQFATGIQGASYSINSGYLQVGNYAYNDAGVTPTAIIGNQNYNTASLNTGVLTITPLAVALTNTPVTKAYDGTTALPAAILPNNTLTASNAISGDDLDVSFVSGSYASRAASTSASFSLLGVQLSGADAGNYSLANYVNTTYTGTGAITGGSGGSDNKQPIIHPPKPIIPIDNTSEGGGGSSGGSSGNPYLVIPSNRANSADRCTPNTLEECLCESQEPKPLEGLAICYQPKKTAGTRSNNKAKQS
jgi:YDG domain